MQVFLKHNQKNSHFHIFSYIFTTFTVSPKSLKVLMIPGSEWRTTFMAVEAIEVQETYFSIQNKWKLSSTPNIYTGLCIMCIELGIHDIHDMTTLHVSRNSHMSPWRWGQDLNTTIIIPVRATRPFSRGVLFSAEVIDFLFFPTCQVRVCRFYERCCLPPPASTSTFSAFASTASSRAERGQCRTSTASSRFQ